MSYIVKSAHEGIIDLLKNAENLKDVLTDAYPYYAHNVAANDVGKINIYVVPGTSTGGDVLHDSPQAENLQTQFILTCDTVLQDDAGAFINIEGESLLDFEEKVLLALQERAFLGVNGVIGWRVQEIDRDIPVVIGGEGEIDYETRRFEITILVDLIYQRTNHDR